MLALTLFPFASRNLFVKSILEIVLSAAIMSLLVELLALTFCIVESDTIALSSSDMIAPVASYVLVSSKRWVDIPLDGLSVIGTQVCLVLFLWHAGSSLPPPIYSTHFCWVT